MILKLSFYSTTCFLVFNTQVPCHVRAQVITELATLVDMSREEVERCVHEYSSNELSAMFNMLLEARRKEKGEEEKKDLSASVCGSVCLSKRFCKFFCMLKIIAHLKFYVWTSK